MGFFGAIAVGLAALSTAADAGPFTPKSSQGAWVANQVERPFVLPKGWLSVGVATDTKKSTQYRDVRGQLRPQKAGVAWRYTRIWFEVEQGFSQRVTLYGRAPLVSAKLDLATGGDISTFDVGDAHLGFVTQPWLDGPHSAAFSMDLKTPTGVEWPSGVGGPGNTESFLTGTGTTNIGLFAHGKLVFFAHLEMGMDLGYVHKFPAIVGYVEQVGGFGNGVLNPGNELQLNGRLAGQVLRRVALSVEARLRQMGQAEIGVSGSGADTMSPLGHTGGTWVDAQVGLSVDPSDNWSLEAWVVRDVEGADTRTFAHLGLEEFAPQSGWTFGGRAVCRW